jgi:phosphohistidine phosphatase SixA
MASIRASALAAIATFSIIGCVVPSFSPPPHPAIASSPTPSVPADIWSLLREGTGYVVLLRHAQTEPGTGDPPGFRLNECSTQRNLSAEGRRQAARIGQVFRDHQIPIVQILSSPYCRCLDTARLLNLGTVRAFPALNSIFEDRTTATEQRQQIRQLLVNHRQTTGVIIMVTHFANIGDISGISPQPGGAVVIRANQQGNLDVVGQIQNW